MDALLDRLRQFNRSPAGSSNWSIMTLWREGFNTADIAEQIGATEADVANRLAAMRDRPHHG